MIRINSALFDALFALIAVFITLFIHCPRVVQNSLKKYNDVFIVYSSMSNTPIHMFTDGSCLQNPGPGGWAALLRYKGTEKMFSGGQFDTTNNQMELMAVIQGLKALTKSCPVELYTDSKYVLDGYTKWLDGWKKRNWKKSDKKPVLNKELWQELDESAKIHTIKWHWVKGHSGHEENERVDQLARMEAEKMKSLLPK